MNKCPPLQQPDSQVNHGRNTAASLVGDGRSCTQYMLFVNNVYNTSVRGKQIPYTLLSAPLYGRKTKNQTVQTEGSSGLEAGRKVEMRATGSRDQGTGIARRTRLGNLRFRCSKWCGEPTPRSIHVPLLAMGSTVSTPRNNIPSIGGRRRYRADCQPMGTYTCTKWHYNGTAEQVHTEGQDPLQGVAAKNETSPYRHHRRKTTRAGEEIPSTARRGIARSAKAAVERHTATVGVGGQSDGTAGANGMEERAGRRCA